MMLNLNYQKCPTCGKFSEGILHDGCFCNAICQGQYRLCHTCSKPFLLTKNKQQSYCSAICRTNYMLKKYPYHTNIIIIHNH